MLHAILLIMKRLTASTLFLCFVLAACGQQVPTGDSAPALTNIPSSTTNDAAQLANRLTLENSTLGIARVGGGLSAQAFQDDYTLIGSVRSPVVNGVAVRATQVTVFGNYAFVSYNREGARYIGGIDVIDISDPTAPRLVSQMALPTTDVNAIYADPANGEVFFAGATDVTALTGPGIPARPRPAVVGRARMNASGQLESVGVRLLQRGFAGNGIVKTATNLFVSSGDDRASVTDPNDATIGGIGTLNSSSLAETAWSPFTRSQFVDFETAPSTAGSALDTFALESGPNAKLHLIKSLSNGLTSHISFGIGAVGPVEGKNTLDASGRWLFVAKGDAGVAGYDLNALRAGAETASPKFTFENQIPALAGNPEDYLSNAVAVDGENVYVAGGAAGVYVTKMPVSGSGRLELQGVFNLLDVNSQMASANFVAVDHARRLLFVASGDGGLKIIQRKVPYEKTAFGSSLASMGQIVINGGKTFQNGAGVFPNLPNVPAPVVADMIARVIPSDCTNVYNGTLNINPSLTSTVQSALDAKFGTSACLKVIGGFNPNGPINLVGKTLQVTGTININNGLTMTDSIMTAPGININGAFLAKNSKVLSSGSLIVNGSNTLSGVVTLAGTGSVSLNGFSSASSETWPNALIASGGSLTINSSVNGKAFLWAGGSMSVNGTLNLIGAGMARGSMVINGTVNHTLETRSDNPDVP
jgi:LVIVD repeat